MSLNRLKYDQCANVEAMRISAAPALYVMDSARFENENKCRHEFGLLGGANVSHISGNLVDLESDLRGITRPASACPDLKYSRPKTSVIQPKNYMKFADVPPIDTTPQHLTSCQMIHYPPIDSGNVAITPGCRVAAVGK
jgi:hypothetical protein